MPDPNLHDAFWTYDDPDVNLCITFNEDMNTAIKPSPDKFSLNVDGVPKEPDSLNWLNDRVLEFNYSEALLSPTAIDLDFPATDPLLRTALGQQVGSFFAVGFELVATLAVSTDGNDYEYVISFNTEMDETVIPLNTDFALLDGVEVVAVTNISWIVPNRLLIDGFLIDGNQTSFTATFATPTPLLRAIDQHQVCPFEVFDTEV